MSTSKINLNKSALGLFKKICDESDKYGVTVEQTESGTTLVERVSRRRADFLQGKL